MINKTLPKHQTLKKKSKIEYNNIENLIKFDILVVTFNKYNFLIFI